MEQIPGDLPQRSQVRIKALERKLAIMQEEMDTFRAGCEGVGVHHLRIPNPTGQITKVEVRYVAAGKKAEMLAVYNGEGNFPIDFYNRMPVLKTTSYQLDGSDRPLLVKIRLTPGYTYRLVYRLTVADELWNPTSLGFFEVGA